MALGTIILTGISNLKSIIKTIRLRGAGYLRKNVLCLKISTIIELCCSL